ncbi:helix-turn-helix domain-containing protein [Mycobacterium marseillense]|uniref:helix-turn-helix domain-containing protein n=1 Tax=Mycobacterium marseillense TaxID=701042 RepID=UPI0035571463
MTSTRTYSKRSRRCWPRAQVTGGSQPPQVPRLFPHRSNSYCRCSPTPSPCPRCDTGLTTSRNLVPLLLREITRGADVVLAPEAMRQLSRLPWPGNVSQLRRVLTDTVARQRSGVINVDKLPPECRSVTRRKLTPMEALERDAIVRSLQDNGGNKQEAARALGMSRATIYRKINDYGIA